MIYLILLSFILSRSSLFGKSGILPGYLHYSLILLTLNLVYNSNKISPKAQQSAFLSIANP